MKTETAISVNYGWSAFAAKRYHKPRPTVTTARGARAQCDSGTMLGRLTDYEFKIPPHLTPCPKCFPAQKSPSP